MKILTSQQVRNTDEFTILNEPVTSIDLMERASQAFVAKFLGLYQEKQQVNIFCGTGNNGGDGLAIARLLIERNWQVRVFVVGETKKGSLDFKKNLERIDKYDLISSNEDFPHIISNAIIVDALFGSGLSRPIEGLYKELVQFLNSEKAQRIAIDISSGLFADQPLTEGEMAFEANCTISFQTPKLAFFLPDCERFVGLWRIVDIGLSQNFIDEQPTDFHFTEMEDVRNLIPVRPTFTHKTKVGELMIVAGSEGKMGAAVLCAKAAFKTGIGLVNVHAPKCGLDVLQISIPEAMVSVDNGLSHIQQIPNTAKTIAIGPGLGTDDSTIRAFTTLLQSYQKPLVIDADAINIIAANDLLDLLPDDSILTPHPGEFRRLVGQWENDFEKLEKLRDFCRSNKVNVVLKGAYSAVCSTEGVTYFNSTGNPGLATAGSGDVLTGIIASFLAQGLAPLEALRLGVFLHGLAADQAVRKSQIPWMQASDIIECMPDAVASLLID